MARGIGHKWIFQEDANRGDFARQLARLTAAETLTVYASSLLPNHFPLSVRTKETMKGALRNVNPNPSSATPPSGWVARR
jgi:hypothetical protein